MENGYREIQPSDRLSAYIECYWALHAKRDDASHRVLPDGCADLLFSRQRGEPLGLWAIGPMTRYRLVAISAEQSFLGVRFRPGMASAFLPGCPADQVLSLGLLWGSAAGRLYDQLGDSRSIEESVRIVEAHLKPPPSPTPIQKAIDCLVRRRGRVSVGELARAAGLSDRQFRRQCLEHSGLTPKRLCRVIRFRHALSRIHTQRNWAQSADEWGYYDQAHMINEFRELSGCTPHDRFFQDLRPVEL